MFSSNPSKAELKKLEKLFNVVLSGVTGHKVPLKFKGTYYPTGTRGNVGIPCLWVPGSPYVILSISQITKELGAHAYFNKAEAFIWNQDGVIAMATVDNGLYYQDEILPAKVDMAYVAKKLEEAAKKKGECGTYTHTVITSYHQSLEQLRFLHEATNHKAYSTLRILYNYPPASKDSPDPLCPHCCAAEMIQPNITQSSKESPSRPNSHWTLDISRKMPSDRRGNQRWAIAADRYTDLWFPLIMKRKSDALQKVEEAIILTNNKQAPFKLQHIKCDKDSVFDSADFKAMCAKHGVQLEFSPPHQQSKNPAENVMRRCQRELKAISFRANMVPGSWSFGLNHVCHVHNAMERVDRASPHEECCGIKPSWKPDKIYGSKCMARLYNRGKLEKTAVECVYLGRDSHCKADIVRPYNSKLASGLERYAAVTRHESNVFPYAHDTVPRPRPYKNERYDSDTDDEEVDEGEIINALAENILASSKTTVHKTPSEKAAKQMTQLPEESVIESMLRDSIKSRSRVMSDRAVERVANQPEPKARKRAVLTSAQALENFNAIVAYAHAKEHPGDGEPPVYYYCYATRMYRVDDNKDKEEVNVGNPFLDLFNPDTDTKWEDPKTIQQVYKHKMCDYFVEAMLKEREAWMRNHVYTIIRRDDIPIDPKTGHKYKVMNVQPIWVTKYKRDRTIEKFKHRLCINGKYQDKTKELTYEPMVSTPALKLFMDLVVRFDLKYNKSDAQEFFLNFNVRDGEKYYMNLPPGWHPEYSSSKYVCQVNKAVYGIPSATQTAGQKLHEHLTAFMGFKATIHDPRVYVKWHTDTDITVVMVHCDDCLWASTKDQYLDEATRDLGKLCKINVQKSPDMFRGMEITDSYKNRQEEKTSGETRSIKISQTEYIKDLPALFGLEHHSTKGVPMPQIPTQWDFEKDIQASDNTIKAYMKMQGCLQWAMLTVPSCNFTVNWLARFMMNPQPKHQEIQKQCLLYMVSIAERGQVFTRQGPPHVLKKGYLFDDLQGAADATWMDRQKYPGARSTTGYVYRSRMGTILYATSKQSNVTTSSCEAEVMANKSCCQQGVWLRGLIQDLGLNFSQPTEILQDNTSSIATCQGDGHHKNSRHFRVACAYLRELIDMRVFKLTWIQSSEMYADILTKALPPVAHKYHEDTLVNSKSG